MLIALLRSPGTTVAVPPPSSVQASATGADATAGKQLFERHCALCHGIEGKGGRGPGLNRAQLAHAPDDTALKSVISDGISPDMPAGWFLTDEDVANLAAYVRSFSNIPSESLPGDAVRGAGVYAKGGCSNCHIVAGAGFGYGPELSNIGIRRSAPYIRKAIVKPGATMPEGFLLVEAITPAGDKIEGIRVNEDTFSIQIKDATGQFHSLRKQDLKELQTSQRDPHALLRGSLQHVRTRRLGRLPCLAARQTMKLAFAVLLCATAFGQVSFDRISNADKEPGNWLTYSGNYQGHRFSPLAEITADNASRLKVKWAYQFPDPNNEVSPIVVDNIMYVSGPNSATALDAHTGRVLWNWKRPLPSDYHSIGFGHVSRGPAVLDDKLYVATLDCYLVALDVKSGIERWVVRSGDYKTAYSMTRRRSRSTAKSWSASVGEKRVYAASWMPTDAKTGKRAWRFWTIPGPGDPGHDSWAGDSWKTGGGPTWVTGTYDPDLNLVFWGVGNPSPDWNGDPRNGDNLYTCSLLALDADSGRLRWYFQFTPHDTHDWDSNHVPILFDTTTGGRKRKLVAIANRNAFYYVLDRVTGEFVAGRPYARQTWATDLDAKGRPIRVQGAEPTEKGHAPLPERERRYGLVQSVL